MPMESWLLGVLGVIAAVNTIAIVAAYRSARSSGRNRQPTNDDVVCTECGTDNEPANRFYRECVSELPGVGDRLGGTPHPSGGRCSN